MFIVYCLIYSQAAKAQAAKVKAAAARRKIADEKRIQQAQADAKAAAEKKKADIAIVRTDPLDVAARCVAMWWLTTAWLYGILLS